MRLGGEATVLEPAALRDEVRDVAERTLRLYRHKS